MDRASAGRKPTTAFQLNERNLLRHLVPVFLEVVETFASCTDVVVQDDLRDKDPAFHNRLASDLRDLGNALQDLSTSAAGDAERRKRTADELLHQLQKVVDSGSSDNEDALTNMVPAEGKSHQEHYDLRVLLSRLWGQKTSLDPDARVRWLRERINLRDVEAQRQRRIIQRVKECREAFSIRDETNLGMLPSSSIGPNVESFRASRFCTHLKQLHQLLTEHWECNCPVRHKSARFSFRAPCSRDADSANLSLFIPYQDPNDPLFHVWKLAKVQFVPTPHDEGKRVNGVRSSVDNLPSLHSGTPHMNGSPAGDSIKVCDEDQRNSVAMDMSTSWQEYWPVYVLIHLWLVGVHCVHWCLRSASPNGSSHFPDDVEPADRKPLQPVPPLEPRPGQMLCSQLEQGHDGRCVRLVANEHGFDVSHVAAESHPGADTTASHKMVTLADVLDDPKKYNEPNDRERFTLALLLAYAYHHFAGGSWWPYGASEDLATRIFFFVRTNGNEIIVDEPFLAFDTVREQGQLKQQLSQSGLVKITLAAFGKLLLELAVNRRISLMQRDAYRTQYEKRPNFFSTKIAEAIKFCIEPDCGLQDEDQLKREFVRKVIFMLQHLMAVGGGPDLELFFQIKSAALITAAREQQTSPKVNMGKEAKHPNDQSEKQDVLPDCLHGDTHELKEDQSDIGKIKGAKRWFKDLKQWRDSALDKGFISKHTSDGLEPVKIAILDTGAKIAPSLNLNLYNNRLKKVRTWCRKDAQKHGEELEDGEDDDGHGTHSASLVLEATGGTNCQVFIAKVFQDSEEKRSQRTGKRKSRNRKFEMTATAQAIAWAIQFAVDKWKVDVISMSFGFPKPVDVIEKAIDHARNKKVLMFASASNSSGNRGLAWPARHEHVICIHATEYLGNPYDGNPTPDMDRNKLAILGECVMGWKATGEDNPPPEPRSGTSSATPIAASISAVLLCVMLHRKADYVADENPEQQRKKEYDYDQRLRRMRQPDGMRSVLKMLAGDMDRQGYNYIVPFEYLNFNEVEKPHTPIENILKRLK